jgi:N-acetyl-gamma-glutamyl-phosphate reductase common form
LTNLAWDGRRTAVGVVGANGFLGGELVRLLAQHPYVHLVAVVAGSTAGRALSEVRPGLRGAGPLVLASLDVDALASSCEVVFLAMPHGESGPVARSLLARGARVIDLGSDLRLRDAEAERRWYGREPSANDVAQAAWYGLPELTGPPPAGWTAIANPGCFATALALALAPISDLAPEVTVFGVTGSSGSGVAPSAGVHHSLRVSSFTAYKTLKHQHMAELGQLLADRGGPVPRVRFLPHSLPAVRGIHLTITLPASPEAVFERLMGAYEVAAMVDVVRAEVPMGAVVGSNRALLGVGGDTEGAVVFAAIDNLLKGGSGQAVQNLNLGMGWPETAGLPFVGMWP